MRILVTGGAGYIGSHTCLELLNQVVVFDNLSNSSEESLRRVKKLTGKDIVFYKADMLDRDALEAIFEKEKIDAVIHFAGLKAVGESVAKPLEYYYNNITGTLVLCDVMRKHEDHLQLLCHRIRRSCLCADHRGLPQGTVHQSLRPDQEHAGTDPYGYPEGGSGVDCDPVTLF